MRKYYSLPLFFFLLASILGLFLRWQFIDPTPGINFSYFVHGHSHVMFLGWVFNVLYLSSIEYHIDVSRRKPYLHLFIFLQALVCGMMISFPLQGYGGFSIGFSAAHTIAVMVFIPAFFRRANRLSPLSYWCLKAAWIFFFLSTLGPFSLGYHMAIGLGDSVWNSLSIYYYLHFQYNGFFMFGVLSLLFRFLEQQDIAVNWSRLKTFGSLTALACVPAYFLSILFSKPAQIFYWLGALGAILQLIALIFLTSELFRIRAGLEGRVKFPLAPVGQFIFAAFVLKCLLQTASAHPHVAEMAFVLRPIMIAYLHLVLIGIITLFVFGWYLQRGFINEKIAGAGLILLIIGFLGSETTLVLLPWWSFTWAINVSSANLLFAFSVFMAAAGIMFYIAFLKRSNEIKKSFRDRRAPAEKSTSHSVKVS